MNKSDPRPLLHRSFAQAHQVMATVAADQLALATPCSDFDVAAL